MKIVIATLLTLCVSYICLPKATHRMHAIDDLIRIEKISEIVLNPQGDFRLCMSPDGKFCIVFDYSNKKISRLQTDTCKTDWIQNLDQIEFGAVNPLSELTVSSDGLMAAITLSNSRKVLLFNTENGKQLNSIESDLALFNTKFSSKPNDRTLYFFSGIKGLDLVKFDLKLEEFENVLTTEQIEGLLPYGELSATRHRDFLIDGDCVILGIQGSACKVDPSNNILKWCTQISETLPVKFVSTMNNGKVLLGTNVTPVATVISTESGEVLKSLKTVLGDQKLIGRFQEKYMVFLSQGVINFPTSLAVYDWDGKVVADKIASKTHASNTSNGFSVDRNGRVILFLDSNKRLTFFQVIETEQGDEPKTSESSCQSV